MDDPMTAGTVVCPSRPSDPSATAACTRVWASTPIQIMSRSPGMWCPQPTSLTWAKRLASPSSVRLGRRSGATNHIEGSRGARQSPSQRHPRASSMHSKTIPRCGRSGSPGGPAGLTGLFGRMWLLPALPRSAGATAGRRQRSRWVGSGSAASLLPTIRRAPLGTGHSPTACPAPRGTPGRLG
jgi:hypothetical protein